MKVTLSLPDELLEALDDYLAKHSSGSRSGICAAALREWIQAKQEEEIEAYYLGLSSQERAEDDDWLQVAAQNADRLWP